MDSDRWVEGSASEFPHEREALAYLRNGMPNHDPYRAWSNVEFIDSNGRLNEVDAIVATPKGVFLIEIKSWPGKLFGDSLTWRTERGMKDNPYRLANAKAKCSPRPKLRHRRTGRRPGPRSTSEMPGPAMC